MNRFFLFQVIHTLASTHLHPHRLGTFVIAVMTFVLGIQSIGLEGKEGTRELYKILSKAISQVLWGGGFGKLLKIQAIEIYLEMSLILIKRQSPSNYPHLIVNLPPPDL